MLLARIVGTVVATRKDPSLVSNKLLLARPVDPQGKAEGNYLVAVDTVDAGAGEVAEGEVGAGEDDVALVVLHAVAGVIEDQRGAGWGLGDGLLQGRQDAPCAGGLVEQERHVVLGDPERGGGRNQTGSSLMASPGREGRARAPIRSRWMRSGRGRRSTRRASPGQAR